MRWHSIRRVIMRLCGFIPALVLFGCATLGGGFETPHIGLAAIRLQEIKGFESIFQVDLRVSNPNDHSLPIQGINCDLALNGRRIANGVANPEREIPAYGSDIVTVTVFAAMIDMVGIAHHLIQGMQNDTSNEKWTYAVKGHIRLNGAVWPGKIPFSNRGEITMEELVGAQPRKK